MDKPVNVLVFPAGEINSVELHDALAYSVNVNLFGASSVDRHGPYIFKNYIGGLPLITEDGFIDAFNNLIHKYSIDVIFPTHDSIALFFAENQDQISAKIVGSDKKTAEICRDKKKIYDLFNDCDFVPEVYDSLEKAEWPVFVKPRQGQGSVGSRKINSQGEADQLDISDLVITEYLPGQEYTVDCLTDKNGELKVISPRSRNRTMAGVSVSGQTEELTDEIAEMANVMNQRLHFRGLWFFQIKKDKAGRFKLLEISVRTAGTMCLTRARGINLPLLSVYTVLGYDVAVTPNDYKVEMDRTLITRYKIDYEYDKVYLDFDDTLIVNGRVNPLAIMFVYQCQTLNKPIILITKHAKDIHQTLKEFHINESLFEEVISIGMDGEKIDRLNPEKAIFIDNAFKERKLVSDKYKIPVFDADAIEVLLDWRT